MTTNTFAFGRRAAENTPNLQNHPRSRGDDLADWASLVPGRVPAGGLDPHFGKAHENALDRSASASDLMLDPTEREALVRVLEDVDDDMGAANDPDARLLARVRALPREVLEAHLAAEHHLAIPPAPGRPAEQAHQHFQNAVRDLRHAMAENASESMLMTDARALLPLLDAETAKSALGLTAEAVLAELIRLGAKNAGSDPVASATPSADPSSLSPDFLAARIREAVDKAESRLAHAIRELRKSPNPEAFLARLDTVRELRRPAGLARRGTHPWAARFEGELVPKATYRALGIVRWARSMTPERAERITLLVDSLQEKAGVPPQDATAATLAFAQGRPIVFIPDFSCLSVKFVRDLWAVERRIVVAAVGRAAQALKNGNPLSAFRIPVIPDPQGVLGAFMAVETVPALVERITGGIRVTAPAGLPSLSLLPDVPTPQWLLTLAEIGMVSRWDGRVPDVPTPKSLQAKAAFCRAFLRLLDLPGQIPAMPAALRDIDRAQRKRYLADREVLKSVVTKELVRVEKALLKREKQREKEKARGKSRGESREENLEKTGAAK